MLKRLVLEFTSRIDADLHRWIEANVPFPSTMVDRITPASTDATYADAERLTGRTDMAAIETEPFTQWVIEDHFADGRPAWEKVRGALMVEDVSAYEKMKLRMLNGAHSLLAYLGYIGGYEFIRDVMDDAGLAALAYRHMHAAARTLDAVPGINLDDYASELIARFANKAIAHRTYQIAMHHPPSPSRNDGAEQDRLSSRAVRSSFQRRRRRDSGPDRRRSSHWRRARPSAGRRERSSGAGHPASWCRA